MYVSFNTGGSWEFLGEGLPVVTIGDIKIHPTENFLVAGTYGRSMYRLDLNSLIDINDDKENTIVNNFKLEQNYPNPFNPNTNIGFRIANFGFVSLKIYDILGNEVATLVNEEKPAGEYEIEFNSHSGEFRNLTSGIYFYRLEAGSYSKTMKMILLK